MRPHISISQSLRKRFVDTFTRSNTTSDAGRSTDGSLWNSLSGLFTVNNNALTTATSASSYPLQVVDMAVQNVSLEIVTPGQGAMAALWVTDAGNWWGVQNFSQPENCNCIDTPHESCSTCYTNSCSTCYTNSCSTCYYGTYYCVTGYYGTYYCSGGGTTCDVRVFGVGCVAWTYTAPTCYADWYTVCTPNSYSCNCSNLPYSCNCSLVPYSCNCSTYYTTSCNTCYPQYFSILKNISGTVSSVWSQAVAAVAAAFRVKTSGDVITIQAYSDSNMTSKIGSDLTYTATGSTKSTKFGLAIAPSSYNQTSNISKITIDRN